MSTRQPYLHASSSGRGVQSPAGCSPFSLGQRLRDIVRSAVRQRRHLVKNRIGQPVDTSKLVTWLDRNPWPSEATVRAFPLFDELDAAMPHHPRGKAMVAELKAMMAPH